MLDKAALFIELTHRNALRQKAQLPLLDIPAEYERAVRLAERKLICAQYYGQSHILADFGEHRSVVTRWLINARRNGGTTGFIGDSHL